MSGITQKIPLIQKPYPALDKIIPPDGSASLIDGWMDEKGALRRRPGLYKWVTLLTGDDDVAIPGQGFYSWDARNIIIAVAGGRVFANSSGDPSQFVEITTTMTKLHPTNPVSFASSPNWLMMANGRADQGILEWNGVLTDKAQFSPSSPRNVIKLGYLDTYFLALPANSNSCYYTNAANADALPTDSFTWSAVPFSADGTPGNIRSLGVGWREIWLIKELSTEIWYNAGNAAPQPPFSRMEGAFIEQGTVAPQSLALVNNAWMFLNHQREIVQIIGRTPTIISMPIQSLLNGYKEVTDAVGFRYDRFYCLTFPTANITWVYDPLIEVWYQWGQWMPEQVKYDRWLVSDVTFVPRWGIHFATCWRDSRIFMVHPSLCTDDNEVIAMEYTSGQLDRGTFRRKVCNELVLKIKRGGEEEKLFGLIPNGYTLFIDLPSGVRCSWYQYVLPDPGDGGSYAVTGLPTGLYYDANTLTIQGTPLANGTFPISISVLLSTGLYIPIRVNLVIADVLPTILFPGE